MNFKSFQKEIFFLSLLLILSIGLNAFLILNPYKARSLLNRFVKVKLIENLSRVEFSPNESSPTFRVVKVKNRNKLYLDILIQKEDRSFQNIQRLELKGNQEAYFDYWNESYSLFALDYDGDGSLDIGVPSFDSFLKAQFELLIYNKNKQNFELKKMRQKPKIKKRIPSNT